MANGEYEDDPTILNPFSLFRRIHPDWVVNDPKVGGKRVTSQAFNDHPDGTPMSVHIADVLAENGIDEISVLDGFDGYSLASITAGLARENDQGIVRKPLDNDPSHGEVFGSKPKSVRRALAKGSTWVVPPEN